LPEEENQVMHKDFDDLDTENKVDTRSTLYWSWRFSPQWMALLVE
jgi:hypothetical protein